MAEAAEGVFPGGSETDRISETKGREPTENSEVTATTGKAYSTRKLNVDLGLGYA